MPTQNIQPPHRSKKKETHGATKDNRFSTDNEAGLARGSAHRGLTWDPSCFH